VVKKLKILLLEDNTADAELNARALARGGIQFETRWVDTERAFRRELTEFQPDIVLSDFSVPGFDGLSALAITRDAGLTTPYIFVSGTIGEERAIESLRLGASDYVLKTNLERLAPAVTRAMKDIEEAKIRRKAEQELRATERRFRLFMHYLPGTAFIKDLDGRYTFLNRHSLKGTGRKAGDALGHTDEDLWPAEVAAQLRRNDERVISRQSALQVTEDLPQADGVRHYLMQKFPILGDNGKPEAIAGIGMDLTEWLQAEQKIARLSRIRAVMSGINSAIVRTHNRQELFDAACRIAVEKGQFRMAWVGLVDRRNEAILPVASYGQDEGYLASIKDWLTLDPDNPVGQGIAGRALCANAPIINNDLAKMANVRLRDKAIAQGYRACVALPLTVDGALAGVMQFYSSEADFFDQNEMTLLNELAGDVEYALQHIAHKEKLNYLAYYDDLTGLANRTLLCDRVNQLAHTAAQEKGRFATIVFDLERFRLVNESLGRHVGDELLKQVADRLNTAFGTSALLARTHTDCFAVILTPVADEADVAHILMQKILYPMSLPFSTGSGDLRVSIKAGISLFPDDGEQADVLLRNAESALRKAKGGGEKYLFYESRMNAMVAERLTLENKLRVAIEQKQFVLHYQPKIDIATAGIVGLEALIRWQEPGGALVPPGKFIGVLEDTGLILEAGQWALRQAAADYQRWTAQGLQPPRIAVNVSPIQLCQKDFVNALEQVIGPTGGERSGLDLEITESVIMEDVTSNISKVRAVREMQLGVAIDDFGTGYSSLSYIARLPVSAIKIDRAFIVNMSNSPEDMSIVSSIISLGHSLNLHIIAEGVETQEQSNLLRLLKCDQLQGFLISRPLPGAEIEALLQQTGQVRSAQSTSAEAIGSGGAGASFGTRRVA
jgi:diguanylate cyclase (GGDEF)-like protein/PAS domain S-box-containing protein